MTHYLVVRVETQAGTQTTQQIIEAIADSLVHLNAPDQAVSGVVAAAQHQHDINGCTGVLKRKGLLVVF